MMDVKAVAERIETESAFLRDVIREVEKVIVGQRSLIDGMLIGLLAGAVLTPLLLPWLPGRVFALKGAIAGLAVGFLGAILFRSSLSWVNSLALIMAISAVSSWCAMHFTGSSTFTSPSGVEKEMRQAIPAQAAALLVGGLCWIATAF